MTNAEVAARIAAHLPPSWPYRHLDELRSQVYGLGNCIDGLEVLGALERVRLANEQLALIAQAVLEIAAKDTKITQKRLAAALDIPPSSLRGLRR